jgi:hypothetical protein
MFVQFSGRGERDMRYLLNKLEARYIRSVRSVNVLDREWDVLVILDACRLDLLKSVASEYEFLSSIEAIYSPAATSEAWLRRTFTNQHLETMRDTAVVTGNPYSYSTLQDDELKILDEVWTYAWDNELGTIPARPITDRAISIGRNCSPSRLIIHYMQPHFPCVTGSQLASGVTLDEFGNQPMAIWSALEQRHLSPDEVKSAAIKNLRYVLEEVGLLLDNLDAESVVISADHGNAFGEGGEYGHRKGSIQEEVRKVPWVRTSATDGETYQPSMYDHDATEYSRSKQLRALGYT